MYIGIKRANTPVKNIQEYETVLNEWKRFAPDIITHFPDKIPSEATNVNFYYFPGFLQSDPRIELRFQTEKAKIDTYYENYKKVTTKSWHGDTWVHRKPPSESDSEIIQLDKDFEIMQFDENPDNLPEHSKEHGVAINKGTNEIIFWAKY
jgi:hypothetical protein